MFVMWPGLGTEATIRRMKAYSSLLSLLDTGLGRDDRRVGPIVERGETNPCDYDSKTGGTYVRAHTHTDISVPEFWLRKHIMLSLSGFSFPHDILS